MTILERCLLIFILLEDSEDGDTEGNSSYLKVVFPKFIILSSDKPGSTTDDAVAVPANEVQSTGTVRGTLTCKCFII